MLSNLIAVNVCLVVVLAAGAMSCAADVHVLTRAGSHLDREAIATLEKQLAEDPTDVDSRTKILGYYFIKGRQDTEASAARRRHLLWLVTNAPETDVLGTPYGHLHQRLDPEGYETVKEAWLKATQDKSGNLKLLSSAASFFLLHDSPIAAELLVKGQALDPKNPQWASRLGQLYSLGLSRIPKGRERQTAALRAFEQYEAAYDLSNERGREAVLVDLAKTALEANRIDDAKQYAEEMLSGKDQGWNHGNLIHHGNLILGRIALVQGDVEEAKRRLLLAGQTSGSPQLNSFGPNMQLASELLEHDENETVLQYFDACAKFWTSPRRELEAWIEDVKANRSPQFGANLDY